VSEKGMKKLKEDGISPLDVTKTMENWWETRLWDGMSGTPPASDGTVDKTLLFIWKRYRMGPPSYKLVYNPI
jgi:hypothetical protein